MDSEDSLVYIVITNGADFCVMNFVAIYPGYLQIMCLVLLLLVYHLTVDKFCA